MAVIIDPDQLNDGVELVISTAAKTVKLVVTGNLSADGVTLKCLYSKLKELWKTNANYIKFPFPMLPITDEQFELVNGWDFDKTGGNDMTPNLIRTGGWALKDANGVSQEEWAGIITLGSLGEADQVYFQQAADGAATNVVLPGAVNQAVKVFGDATHGEIDYRSYFKLFVREYQKTYASAQLNDIGVSALTYQVYRFPLQNGADLKITHADGAVSGYGVTITWHAAAQQRSIGGTNRSFHVIINGNNKTAEEIYEAVQYALRQAADIDAGAGSKTGKTAADLLKFVGDNLETLPQAEGGVYIDNFQVSDTNRLALVDDSGTKRTFPYVAALTLQFGDNLKGDANAVYRVYKKSEFGTAGATPVKDKDNNDMAGNVSGASQIQKAFDYDGSGGADLEITVVAIGLGTAQYVKAEGVIQRSTANVVSLVSTLERNYQNA